MLLTIDRIISDVMIIYETTLKYEPLCYDIIFVLDSS